MPKKRLAIVGCGSSGLICLKYAVDTLPDWEIVAFEKSGDVTGCWGRPPSGFVSTSTRYTTQFACYRRYDASVEDQSGIEKTGKRYPEFFREGEYGNYLEDFVKKFGLSDFISRHSHVSRIDRHEEGDWSLTVARKGKPFVERFSAVVVCTGLVNRLNPIQCDNDALLQSGLDSTITGKKIVVVGGGESAVDMAQRLSAPELGNQVFLSLRSGIRVSPRYHPIRGVPSDFLRNRLLLSIHEDIRNRVGQKFVEFRIASQNFLEWVFPPASRQVPAGDSSTFQIRKKWSMKLTMTAKDQLFNMYHNKSDDFLDSVAEQRITIIGKNIDSKWAEFCEFDSDKTIAVSPDLVIPSVGYRSGLGELSDGKLALRDFYLGCCHSTFDNLFLIGFTRPIIGNIPSISEMQARFVTGLISGRIHRPTDIQARHQGDREKLQRRYPRLDTDNVYPVEMFPYCDVLARQIGCFPTIHRVGSIYRWARMMLAPATTIHYFENHARSVQAKPEPIHAPWLITLLLLMIKPIDFAYRLWCRVQKNDGP